MKVERETHHRGNLLRGWGACSCTVQYYNIFFSHNIYTTSTHAGRPCRQSFFTTGSENKIRDEWRKNLSPKIGRNVLHINIKFWVDFSRKCSGTSLFSSFSHTQQIVWRVASRLHFPTTLPLTYVRESGIGESLLCLSSRHFLCTYTTTNSFRFSVLAFPVSPLNMDKREHPNANPWEWYRVVRPPHKQLINQHTHTNYSIFLQIVWFNITRIKYNPPKFS